MNTKNEKPTIAKHIERLMKDKTSTQEALRGLNEKATSKKEMGGLQKIAKDEYTSMITQFSNRIKILQKIQRGRLISKSEHDLLLKDQVFQDDDVIKNYDQILDCSSSEEEESRASESSNSRADECKKPAILFSKEEEDDESDDEENNTVYNKLEVL